MRGYLAIIKDSFREAMSSWVLWLLLVGITLFLLVIAPLGLKQQLTTTLSFTDLQDPVALLDQLQGTSDKPQSAVAKRVWSMVDEKSRDELKKSRTAIDNKDDSAFLRLMVQLARALDDLLKKEDFYARDDWKDVRLEKEAEDFVAKGYEALNNDERRRMNLVLLESAFPDQFVPRPSKSLVCTYLFWNTPAIPVQQSSVRQFIEETVLSNFMSWVVGSVAVLVAVVVTAPIIPQMFDPGSLHLLLSKPVNRTLLFLSKFVGGCAFILLNVSYLIVGLWLILGVRFGIWNIGMLYCIPIFLFLFAMYYTVSAFAGVVWRNAIVSVIIAVVFWAACFSVGFLKVNVLDELWKPQRIVKLIPAGESLLVVNESGETFQWDDAEHSWQPVFRGGAAVPAFVGPLYDAKHDQLVGVNSAVYGLSIVPVQVVLGKREEGWRRHPGVGMPFGTIDMFIEPEQNRKPAEQDQPGLLVVSTRGLYRYADVPSRKILGVDVTFGSGPQLVPVAADPELFFNTPAAAALNAGNGKLAVYSRGKLQMFEADAAGKYVAKQQSKLDLKDDEPAILSFAGSTILLARGDGKIQIIDPDTLSVRKTFQGERTSQPRFVTAAPFGKRFAIVFQNGRLWMFDEEADSLSRVRVAGQGDISSAAFKSSSRLLVADRTNRVSEYTVDNYTCESRLAPVMPLFEKVYRYGVNPVYTVFPKPGEFGRTVQFVLTGKDTTKPAIFADNMQMATTKLNPWRPVWSGLVFMVIMLGLACLYIERQEF